MITPSADGTSITVEVNTGLKDEQHGTFSMTITEGNISDPDNSSVTELSVTIANDCYFCAIEGGTLDNYEVELDLETYEVIIKWSPFLLKTQSVEGFANQNCAFYKCSPYALDFAVSTTFAQATGTTYEASFSDRTASLYLP